MPLTDMPTIKPPENVIYISALLLVTFIFFFTQSKTGDAGRGQL